MQFIIVIFINYVFRLRLEGRAKKAVARFVGIAMVLPLAGVLASCG
jgi:hypothetical protein